MTNQPDTTKPMTEERLEVLNRNAGLGCSFSNKEACEVLDEIERLRKENQELRKDRHRLDMLIKQGPPGAAESIGLNDELWELSYQFESTDMENIRQAIDMSKVTTETKG